MDTLTKSRVVYTAWFGGLIGAYFLVTKRRALIAWCKKFESSEGVLAFLEFVFTVASTAVATHFKVWEMQLKLHPLMTGGSLALVLGFALLAGYAKWLRDRVKDRDKERVTLLSAEIEKTQVILGRYKRLGAQIRGLVDRKIKRVRETARKPQTVIDDLIVKEARAVQIHTILRSIHDFFFFEIRNAYPQAKMRLALYLPTEEPQPRLEPYYSWDGENQGCINPAQESMLLMSPDGIPSEIVRTYHQAGDHCLRLIPDCEKQGDFHFHRIQQRQYLKSMLAFKYQYQKDGTPAALVLSLDCDQPNFFSADRYDEISEFLVEMLKRFEYEMLGLEIVAKLLPPPL